MFFVDLENKIKNLTGNGVEIFSIGKTICGRDIWCVRIGNSGKRIIVQYGIHAREYITSMLAYLHIRDKIYCDYGGIVYFVPIANPDGVALCMDGIRSVKSNEIAQKLLSINGGDNFELWKANARCVDLNVNFDASWGNGEKNIKYENSENYIGEYPNSENEVQALVRLTKIVKPDATISYHSKGEEIYYQFGQTKQTLLLDKMIAQELCNVTGYELKGQGNSVGGYKDWCISKFNIPSFTIEIGNDKYLHPLKVDKLIEIWRQNKFVLKKLLALL